jgi:hypothetical protein
LYSLGIQPLTELGFIVVQIDGMGTNNRSKEARRRDPNRIFDLDMALHGTIVEASAGPRLFELHRST